MNKPIEHNGEKKNFGSVLNDVRALDPRKNPLYCQRDDISFARLFADVFRDVARYNSTANAWYVYDGRRWKLDQSSMWVEGYAKSLSRALLIYSADLDDADYARCVAKYGDRHRRKTQIEDARDFSFFTTESLDQDPFLFNCQNCVIDLRTGSKLEHSPDLLLSKISNVVYDPEAQSDAFIKFVGEIMCDDAPKIRYLQELFGYTLTGDASQEEAYFCYGSSTRNGKSTLLDVYGWMMGDYAKHAQPETLALQKDRSSRSPSGDIARLAGCRFLHVSEPPKRMALDSALFKTLTGRDPVTARHLHEREFEFTPVFKLFINSNFLPLVGDDTVFSSERIKVITFDRHFSPKEQDPKIKQRLKSEANISGLFNWCLEGLASYRANNEKLSPPQSVTDATEDYRRNSDKLRLFFTDCLVRDPEGIVSAKKLYEVYTAWCEENGFGIENKSNFLDDLRTRRLLTPSGTIYGQTVRNVVKGYQLDESIVTGDPFGVKH